MASVEEGMGSQSPKRPINEKILLENSQMQTVSAMKTHAGLEKSPDFFNSTVAPFEIRRIKKRTLDNYTKYLLSMKEYSLRKMKKELLSKGLTPMRIARDMFDREDISDTTKNSYAAALIHFFKCIIETEGVLEALQYVYERRALLARRNSKKSDNRNFIPEEDLLKILTYLKEWCLQSKWAQRCLIAVRATIATGLRPSEWAGVGWSNRIMGELWVENAKVKISPPAYSEMTLEEWDRAKMTDRFVCVFDEFDRSFVDAHINSFQVFKEETGKGIEQFNHGLRDAFRKVCLNIWGKAKYTFTDLRGQFAANARGVFGPELAAQMMGHSGPNTPSRGHYGLASQAFSGIKLEKNRLKENEQDKEQEPPSRPRDKE